jgi:hypothetical protein
VAQKVSFCCCHLKASIELLQYYANGSSTPAARLEQRKSGPTNLQRHGGFTVTIYEVIICIYQGLDAGDRLQSCRQDEGIELSLPEANMSSSRISTQMPQPVRYTSQTASNLDQEQKEMKPEIV